MKGNCFIPCPHPHLNVENRFDFLHDPVTEGVEVSNENLLDQNSEVK